MREVTFTVEPSEEHHDILTIQDAFQQAIDFFSLLTDDEDGNVVWNLTMASTNSPFTCQGRPVDVRTFAGAEAAVEARVKIVQHNFGRIASGQDFDDSFPKNKIEIARKILRRNTNGIGATTAKFSEKEEPLRINQDTAKRYFSNVLAPVESLHSYLFSRTARREHGSIDGRIIEIGTDYDFPAIHLEEHKTGRRIWCRINGETASRLGDEIRAGDAWGHKRVRVRGTVNYNAEGDTIRILDGTVAFIETTEIDLNKIEDKNFTEGYAVSEYLDRLQENEFGRR